MRRLRASEERGGSSLVVSTCALLTVLAGCNENPHYIGDVCPSQPAGSNTCPTFSVGLDTSGVSGLKMDLALPGATLPPVERLRGETAKDAVWTADAGGELGRGVGTPTLGLEAPFTDDTRSVGLASGASSYVAVASTTGAVGKDDFAIELVLRATAGATLFNRASGGVGWGLSEGNDGEVIFEASDAPQTTVTQLVSRPLLEGAWYHCMVWVSRGDYGRIDCNARMGTPVSFGLLGDLDGASSLAAGGGIASGRVALLAIDPNDARGARLHLELARGRRATVRDADGRGRDRARQRRAEPEPARQPRLPRHAARRGRDAPALSRRRGVAARRLSHRHDERARVRLPQRARARAARPVGPGRVHGQRGHRGGRSRGVRRRRAAHGGARPHDGERAAHALRDELVQCRAPRVLLLRARGERSRASASRPEGSRRRSTMSPPARSSPRPPASTRASKRGATACSDARTASRRAPGSTTYTVQLGNPTATAPVDAPFSGDGTSAAVFIAGLQADVGLRAPGSLLAADAQAADHLVFPASAGNLPARGGGLLRPQPARPPGHAPDRSPS